MSPHHAPVCRAGLLQRVEVLLPALNIDGKAPDALDSAARFSDDVDGVSQRLLELRCEPAFDDRLVRIPSDLTGDQEDSAAAKDDTVGVAARRAERLGIDYFR